MQVTAASFGQNVTLKQRNVSIAKLFYEIRKQTGFDVMVEDVNFRTDKRIDVSFSATPLNQVLDEILSGTQLMYTIEEKRVFIKEKPFADRAKERFAEIDVKGRVVDSLGNGLPGATVMLKTGKNATSTDTKGMFTLKRIPENGILVIHFMGFISQEVAVSKDFLNITLQQSASKLDEVKVIAYGTTTQRLSTGNSQSIKAIDIEKQPVNNPLYALQGRVTGLQITPSSGLPGGDVSVQLRGNNSLSFTTAPLIVVDGLPIANNIPSLGGVYFQLSSLNFINPNDIESMDVLKDADATSIYGSRGANGVILITTKKGKAGETKVDLNYQNGFGSIEKKIDMLSTNDYLLMRKEAFTNSGVDFINTFPYDTPPELKSLFAPDLFVWDQNRFTDWQKQLIGGTSKYHDIQGAISGGNSAVQYILSGNFHKETTVFPGTNSDQKGNFHIGINGASPDQKFKVILSASYNIDKNTLPGIDFTREAFRLSPNAPSIYKPDGTLNWETLPNGASSWNNPYAELYRIYDAKTNNLIASADLNYQILPSLKIKTQVGYNRLSGDSFISGGTLESTPPQDLSPNLVFGAAFNSNAVTNLSVEPQIHFKSLFGPGTISALLGSSFQNSNLQSQRLDAIGFKNQAVMRNLGAATSITGTSTSSQYKYAAIFARLNYNISDKYILNTTIRRDGSSRFGPGNKYGTFGSVGAAWIFSEEDWLKNIPSVLSFGKIRASYGSSGNDGISDYAYFERYDPIIGPDNYQGAGGLTTTGIFNSNYHWETTKKIEIGLETGFFNDRIILALNYFRNRSDNQLLSAVYPSTVGPGSAIVNQPALIQNNGFEFTLNSTNVKTKDFTWTSAVNFTRNRNKLIDFPDLENSNYYSTLEIGQPFFGVKRAYNSAGVNSSTGLYQFIRPDGSYSSDPTVPGELDGGQYLRIMTIPKFYGGLSNTFSFKNFSLDIFIQFVRQTGTNPLISYTSSTGLAPSNLPIEFIDRWRGTGGISSFQRLTGTFNEDVSKASDYLALSDAAYVDASFVRIKNLSLSYNIPLALKQKLHLKNLRLYVQGQNLLTITPYKGLDPEIQSITTLPQLRMLTTGLQLTF